MHADLHSQLAAFLAPQALDGLDDGHGGVGGAIGGVTSRLQAEGGHEADPPDGLQRAAERARLLENHLERGGRLQHRIGARGRHECGAQERHAAPFPPTRARPDQTLAA